MVAIKKYSVAKKKENVKGRTLHDILHADKKGKTLHDIVHEGLMRRTARFRYSKFTHSCRVSELREVKREMQVMPRLMIIFQESFSFNLLVANWRLSPEFWSPNIFSTRHGNQNGRSLECCTNKFSERSV